MEAALAPAIGYAWEPEAPHDLDAFLSSLMTPDLPLSTALLPGPLAIGFGLSSESSGTSWQSGWPHDSRARSRAADAPQSRPPPAEPYDPAMGPPPPVPAPLVAGACAQPVGALGHPGPRPDEEAVGRPPPPAGAKPPAAPAGIRPQDPQARGPAAAAKQDQPPGGLTTVQQQMGAIAGSGAPPPAEAAVLGSAAPGYPGGTAAQQALDAQAQAQMAAYQQQQQQYMQYQQQQAAYQQQYAQQFAQQQAAAYGQYGAQVPYGYQYPYGQYPFYPGYASYPYAQMPGMGMPGSMQLPSSTGQDGLLSGQQPGGALAGDAGAAAAAVQQAVAAAAAGGTGHEGGHGAGHEAEETEEARAVKRPRLIWTPALHKRFVDAVGKCGGVDKCLPKSIMKEMGVKGLTRENVASHLQKHRLRLKREGEDAERAEAAADAQQQGSTGAPMDVAGGGGELLPMDVEEDGPAVIALGPHAEAAADAANNAAGGLPDQLPGASVSVGMLGIPGMAQLLPGGAEALAAAAAPSELSDGRTISKVAGR